MQLKPLYCGLLTTSNIGKVCTSFRQFGNERKITGLAPLGAAAAGPEDPIGGYLREKYQRLAPELKNPMAMTVTGTGDTPIYASADFSMGRFSKCKNFWEVPFAKQDDAATPTGSTGSSVIFPYSVLGGLSIFFGGILLYKSYDDSEGLFVPHNSKETARLITLEGRTCWITVELLDDGVDKENFAMISRGVSLDVFWSILCDTPDSSLRLHEISFFTDDVPGPLARLALLDPLNIGEQL